eukprot:scaffold2134_cov384-Prasinococcus_capsulatus_cf.AAC.13
MGRMAGSGHPAPGLPGGKVLLRGATRQDMPCKPHQKGAFSALGQRGPSLWVAWPRRTRKRLNGDRLLLCRRLCCWVVPHGHPGRKHSARAHRPGVNRRRHSRTLATGGRCGRPRAARYAAWTCSPE